MNEDNNKITSLGLTGMPMTTLNHLKYLKLGKFDLNADEKNIRCKGAKLLNKAEFPYLEELLVSRYGLN